MQKQLMGVQKWDRHPPSVCKVWWGLVDAQQQEMKINGVLSVFFIYVFFVMLDVMERGPDVQQGIALPSVDQFSLCCSFICFCTSQVIGWEDRLQNDPKCAEWDVKPYHTIPDQF